jgi:hypothetical protein
MARTNVVAVKINWPVARGLGPPVPPSPCEKLERIHNKRCHFMLMICITGTRIRRCGFGSGSGIKARANVARTRSPDPGPESGSGQEWPGSVCSVAQKDAA